ncbi:uncharacterized protein [Musca autumnalis]|uniref:uncharacterized protein n=1 Tax=Musca autumnalis TaxID=221902 RepID=UPI003CEDF3E8
MPNSNNIRVTQNVTDNGMLTQANHDVHVLPAAAEAASTASIQLSKSIDDSPGGQQQSISETTSALIFPCQKHEHKENCCLTFPLRDIYDDVESTFCNDNNLWCNLKWRLVRESMWLKDDVDKLQIKEDHGKYEKERTHFPLNLLINQRRKRFPLRKGEFENLPKLDENYYAYRKLSKRHKDKVEISYKAKVFPLKAKHNGKEFPLSLGSLVINENVTHEQQIVGKTFLKENIMDLSGILKPFINTKTVSRNVLHTKFPLRNLEFSQTTKTFPLEKNVEMPQIVLTSMEKQFPCQKQENSLGFPYHLQTFKEVFYKNLEYFDKNKLTKSLQDERRSLIYNITSKYEKNKKIIETSECELKENANITLNNSKHVNAGDLPAKQQHVIPAISPNFILNLTSNVSKEIKHNKFPTKELVGNEAPTQFPLATSITERYLINNKRKDYFPLITQKEKDKFPLRNSAKNILLLNLNPLEIQELYELNKIPKTLQTANTLLDVDHDDKPLSKFPFKERVVRKFYRKFPQSSEIHSTMTDAVRHMLFINNGNKQQFTVNSLNTDSRANVNKIIESNTARSMTQKYSPTTPQSDIKYYCQKNEKHALAQVHIAAENAKSAVYPKMRMESISPGIIKSAEQQKETDVIINTQNENISSLLANIRNSMVNHRQRLTLSGVPGDAAEAEDADDEYDDGDDIDEEVANILRAASTSTPPRTTSVQNTERIRAQQRRRHERDLDDLCNPQVAQIVECSDVRDTLTITVERNNAVEYNNRGTAVSGGIGLGENQLNYSPPPCAAHKANASSLNDSVSKQQQQLTSHDISPHYSEILLPKLDVLEYVEKELKNSNVCAGGVHPELNEDHISIIRGETVNEKEVTVVEQENLVTNVKDKEVIEMKYEMKSNKSGGGATAQPTIPSPASRATGKYETSNGPTQSSSAAYDRNKSANTLKSPATDHNYAAASTSRRLSTDSNNSGRSTPTLRHVTDNTRSATRRPSIESLGTTKSYSGSSTPSASSKYANDTNSLSSLRYGNDNNSLGSRYGHDNSVASSKYDLPSRKGQEPSSSLNRYGNDFKLNSKRHSNDSISHYNKDSPSSSRYGNDSSALTSLRYGNDVTSRYGNDNSLHSNKYDKDHTTRHGSSDISPRYGADSSSSSLLSTGTSSGRSYTPSLGAIRNTATTTLPNSIATPIESSSRNSLTQAASLSVDDSVGDRSSRLRRQRRLRSQDSQDGEDPIERLNRLKARITASLSEVKGVLKQYSTEENENQATGTSLPLATRNKIAEPIAESSEESKDDPTHFRFVKRIRKHIIFPEDEENKNEDNVENREEKDLNVKSVDEVDRGVTVPKEEEIQSKQNDSKPKIVEILDKTDKSESQVGEMETNVEQHGNSKNLDTKEISTESAVPDKVNNKQFESLDLKVENENAKEADKVNNKQSESLELKIAESVVKNAKEADKVNNKQSESLELKTAESEVKIETDEKSTTKKNQNKKSKNISNKNESKISPKSKTKQIADDKSTEDVTKENKPSEKKAKTNDQVNHKEKVRRNSKILNKNSKEVTENITKSSKQNAEKSTNDNSKHVNDSVQMAPNVNDQNITGSSSQTAVKSSELEANDNFKPVNDNMAPNINGPLTSSVNERETKIESTKDSKICDDLSAKPSDMKHLSESAVATATNSSMAPNINGPLTSLLIDGEMKRDAKSNDDASPKDLSVSSIDKNNTGSKEPSPAIIATNSIQKLSPSRDLTTTNQKQIQTTNKVSPPLETIDKSAANVETIAKPQILVTPQKAKDVSPKPEVLETPQKTKEISPKPENTPLEAAVAPIVDHPKDTSLTLNQKKEMPAQELADTFDEKSLKTKKKLPAKTKTVGATSRRASLAAVEGSKIEPAVKLATPGAIQRRPSDSEAIVKKKLITGKLNTSGNVSEVTPKPKIVKVKRSSITAKANDDKNQTQTNDTRQLTSTTTTIASSDKNNDNVIDNVSMASNKSFHIEGDQKQNKDVTLPNDEKPTPPPPATRTTTTGSSSSSLQSNQILPTQLVIDEQKQQQQQQQLATIIINEKPPSIPLSENSRTIEENSSVSNEATNEPQQKSTTTKNFETAKFENNVIGSSMLANVAETLSLLESSNTKSEASSISQRNRGSSDFHDLLQESSVIVKPTENNNNKTSTGTSIKLETSSGESKEKLEQNLQKQEQQVSETTTPASPALDTEPSNRIDIAKTTSSEQRLTSATTTTTTVNDTPLTVTTAPIPTQSTSTTSPLSTAEEAATKINSSPQISISRKEDATADTQQPAEVDKKLSTTTTTLLASEQQNQIQDTDNLTPTNMPELNQTPAPVQTAEIPHEPGDKLKKKIIIKKIIRQTSIDKAKKSEAKEKAKTGEEPVISVDTNVSAPPSAQPPSTDSTETKPSETEIATPQIDTDVTSASEECSGSTTEISESESGAAGGDDKPKKVRKVKNKVIIKRQKRKLSICDSSFFGHNVSNEEPVNTEVETLEKAIAYVTDDESEEEDAEEAKEVEEEKKPLKSCINKKEYNIGDDVLYGERYRRNTQIRWRRGRIKERITSISYLIDIDGIEVSSHINYLKKYTGRKVQFGAKEYLEIDYEQIAEEEERADRVRRRSYSIWNMVSNRLHNWFNSKPMLIPYPITGPLIF